MLYTRHGDQGKTGLYCCQQRVAKTSSAIEALGAVDELNSLLGVIKVETSGKDKKLAKILGDVQRDLFVAQAEIAGAKKKIDKSRVVEVEEIINEIEKKLPPIKTFLISGGTKVSA